MYHASREATYVPHHVLLGAGSRDGDRLANLAAGLGLIERAGLHIERVSSVYETQPVDLPGQDPFLNGAIAAVTPLEPAGILAACLAAERALGRRRAGTAGGKPDPGPRPLDLDILLCDDLVVDEPALVIPHPRLQHRRFVLEPLAEIAPGRVHPVLGRTIRQLLEESADGAWVRLVSPPGAWWRGPAP